MQQAALAVASIGYLVPRTSAACVVHSVFAHAVNLACEDLLLTLAAPRAGDGPTTLLLTREPAQDLRSLFAAGVKLNVDHDVIRSPHAVVDLASARVWRSLARRTLAPRAAIEDRFRVAEGCLTAKRRSSSSVIDGAAAPLVDPLVRAVRALDLAQARDLAHRFVGWGEGLTPAGDDFLVGLLAALDSLAPDVERRNFFSAFAVAVADASTRTTDVAAHFLRLAARGHYVEHVDTLRNALLSAHCYGPVQSAVQRALDSGATSGADTVSGLLAGAAAWLPLELKCQ